MINVKLKKGYNLNLKGKITDSDITKAQDSVVLAIVPDDFNGITPRLEKKEGDTVSAGEAIYHDKVHEAIKVTAPVDGCIQQIIRGERRKIEKIIIKASPEQAKRVVSTETDATKALLNSGLWVMLRQRPYDIVPAPEVTPRDIFVTCFNTAPLSAPMKDLIGDDAKYLSKGVEKLSEITSGKVYLGCANDFIIEDKNAETVVFEGPHPAGNAGVQAANIKPVNKGEVIWTLNAVTLAKIGKFFTEGYVDYSTIVAVTGENVIAPKLVSTTMGAPIKDIVKDNLKNNGENARIICGSAICGVQVGAEDYLRAPFTHITVIPNVANPDEFMGWASLNPKRHSIYPSFTSWILGKKHAASFDARIMGEERAIVMAGEYDKMLPMDIYAEFLLKAIITFDIEKMEALGIYEVAPEDFALAEYADTSKLELQRIVREGLNKLYAEMN